MKLKSPQWFYFQNKRVVLCAVLSRSVLFDSVTPWTVARQPPLSMGILQATILEWVAMSFSRDLPNPGIEQESPALQMDYLSAQLPGVS